MLAHGVHSADVVLNILRGAEQWFAFALRFRDAHPPHRMGPLLPRAGQFGANYRVEIKPVLVATIQRLPQRTMESIFPTPGTTPPRVTLQIPFGPSKMAVPPITSRTVQPSIVVGLVSATAMGLVERFARSLVVGPRVIVFCFVGKETAFVVWAPPLDASCARPVVLAVEMGLFVKFGVPG